MKKILAVMLVILAASCQLACNKSATPTSTGNPAPNSSIQFSTIATGLSSPRGLAVDSAGNVYYTQENYSGNVVKITPAGAATTVVSGLVYPRAVLVDQGGSIYVNCGSPGRLFRALGNFHTTLSSTRHILGIALSNGTLYCSSPRSGSVVSLSTGGGPVSTIASGFNKNHGVAVDPTGVVYVEDKNNNIYKIVGGVQSTFASGLSTPWGMAVDNRGNLFVSEEGNGKLDMFTPTGTKTVLNTYSTPRGVAVDNKGGVYVVDSGTNSIYKVQLPVWP